MAAGKRKREQTQNLGDGSSAWLVPVAIIAVVALLIGVVIWLNAGADGDDPATAETAATEPAAVEHPDSVATPDLSSEEARDPDDLLAVGPVDAPVGMVVFSDFQCQYCARWSHETLPVLMEYVDRGDLRIEFRDVNIYGDDSERAAKALLAAAQQDAFLEYHEALFPEGEVRSSGELSEDALVASARELGLDVEQFRTDLTSDQTAEVIAANAQQGWDLGTMSTPAFIIGGTPTIGAQPTAEFTRMVDEKLAAAEG